MTILFMDGFDYTSSAELNTKWSSSNVYDPWVILPGAGINGGGSVTTGSPNGYIQKNLPIALTSFLTGMISYGTDTNNGTISILTVKDAESIQFTVQVQPDGSVIVRNAEIDYTTYTNKIIGISNPDVIKANTWQRIQIKATIGTSGSVIVSVDKKIIISISNVKTQNTANAYCTALGYSVRGGSRSRLDDIFISNLSGTQNNDFLDIWDIATLVPKADGTYSNFIPSTGTEHWKLVNGSTPSLTTSVSSSVSGSKDTYKFSSISLDTGAVLGVQISNFASKDGAGSIATSNLLISNGSNVQSPPIELATSQNTYLSIHELDPATNKAFTVAAINELDCGIMAV